MAGREDGRDKNTSRAKCFFIHKMLKGCGTLV